jgi:hypothetical protein
MSNTMISEVDRVLDGLVRNALDHPSGAASQRHTLTVAWLTGERPGGVATAMLASVNARSGYGLTRETH